VRRRVAALVVAAVLLVAVTVGAQSPEGLRVTPLMDPEAVSVSLSAEGAVSPDANEVLHSGLLLTLTFLLDLKRPSLLWWDHTVRSVVVASSIKFDNLTGLYQVSRSEGGHVTWSERTKDFAEARRWLAFERVWLAAGAELEPNGDYYVQVRMTSSPRRTFPLWPFGGAEASIRAAFTFIR
jgi:hypothetical protein